MKASNALAKAFSLASSDSASLSRSPSKKMHVRGRSSRQQPWWLFVIALSYVLVLTFSSAAPTGRALQQSNPELSAVKNVHPEVYHNLAKASLRKRADPKEIMSVEYPGEKFFISNQRGKYNFHFLNLDGSGVKQTLTLSQLPKKMKANYEFMEKATERDLSGRGIKLTNDLMNVQHTYENPMQPAQRIRVFQHSDGKVEFEYLFPNGIRRVPANKLPVGVQNYVENISEIANLMRNAASSSRVFRSRK
ncbi:hypothetical protein NDA18_004938 [Ustilago nuda]|nr:hypothetical protein NDA18_004938 [Ustilago nuda]